MPYDAAKAVAARFCYEIRHVLVPVFGPDFVSMCRNYADRSYLHLKVDRSIIERCTDAAKVNQAHSREASVAVSPRPPASFVSLSMCRASKSLRSKLKAVDVESGYGTDSDRSEKYPGSPSSLGYNGWTPVNSPRLETYRFLPPNSVTSTPRTSDPPATLQSGTRSCAKRVLSDIDRASEEESWSETSSAAAAALAKRRKISAVISPEIGAAYTLIQMNMADATLGERKEAKRRRASA